MTRTDRATQRASPKPMHRRADRDINPAHAGSPDMMTETVDLSPHEGAGLAMPSYDTRSVGIKPRFLKNIRQHRTATRHEAQVGGRCVRVDGDRNCRVRQIVRTLALSTRSWGPWVLPPGLGLTWRCARDRHFANAEVAVVEPDFSDPERYALAVFLAGYRGLTRDAYALDLRQFVAWCKEHDRRLFAVRRADIECFARDLEARGRAGRPSPAGCARWPASTATPSRKACSSAGHGGWPELVESHAPRQLTASAWDRLASTAHSPT